MRLRKNRAYKCGVRANQGAIRGERRKLLWELGLVPRAQSVPGSGGDEKQLALPLDPTAAAPALREQSPWERMLADYRT